MSRDEGFLKRWSRLKSTSEAGTDRPTADVAPVETTSAAQTDRSTADVAPVETGSQFPPPVESLTPESDFAPFMRGDIEPQLRADALKKLFADPRFNVMDGLDVYIDDYSKPDPLPEGWLEKMNQVARLGVFQPQEPATPAEGQPVAVAGATAPEEALAAPETHAPRESSNGAAQAPLLSKNEGSDGS